MVKAPIFANTANICQSETRFIPEVQSGVSAGVYTQTTDVEIECNGIMTYDRKVIKVDEERFRAINQKVIASMGK